MKRIWYRAAAALLCAGLLAGCSRLMTWTIFDTVNLLQENLGGGDYGTDWGEDSVNTSTDYLMEGDNVFELEPYPLSQGVAPILEELDRRLGNLLDSRFNVDQVQLNVDQEGNVVEASLQVTQYLGTEPGFNGGFTVRWAYETQILTYYTTGTLYSNDPTGGYNENLSADFLNANLAALPAEAIKTIMPDGFTVRFTAFSRPLAGETMVDMRNPPQQLDMSQAARWPFCWAATMRPWCTAWMTAGPGPRWTWAAPRTLRWTAALPGCCPAEWALQLRAATGPWAAAAGELWH